MLVLVMGNPKFDGEDCLDGDQDLVQLTKTSCETRLKYAMSWTSTLIITSHAL